MVTFIIELIRGSVNNLNFMHFYQIVQNVNNKERF